MIKRDASAACVGGPAKKENRAVALALRAIIYDPFMKAEKLEWSSCRLIYFAFLRELNFQAEM